MPLKSAHPAARPDTAILRSVTAFLAAFGLATVISVSAQAAGQSPQTSAERVAQLRPTGVAAGRYIVVFEDSVARSQVRANAIALARANGFALRHVYSTALKGFAAELPPQALLVDQAGQEVLLTVRAKDAENGAKPRRITVKTLQSETLARYRDWVAGNRERVRAARRAPRRCPGPARRCACCARTPTSEASAPDRGRLRRTARGAAPAILPGARPAPRRHPGPPGSGRTAGRDRR